MNNSKISYRSAKIEDAEALVKIYAPYVLNTAVSFEYQVPSVQEFSDRIRQRLEGGYPYFVAEAEDEMAELSATPSEAQTAASVAEPATAEPATTEPATEATSATEPATAAPTKKIIGYAYASPFHPRKAYETSAELSVYIDEKFHGGGIGRQLVSMIEEALIQKGVFNLYSLVATTPRNPDPHLTDASLYFHEKLGFETVGKLDNCGKKFGQFYGIVYLEKRLQEIPRTKQIPEVKDVYDNRGRQTGKTGIRGKWTKGNIQSVVHVCIFNKDGKMLIQQRVKDKDTHPNFWDVTLGGNTDVGEYPDQAASRELLEELGIDYSFKGKSPTLTLSFDYGFDSFFFINEKEGYTKAIPQTAHDLQKLTLQPDEVQAVDWADCQTIKEMIDKGTFIPYKKSLIDLLFSLNGNVGVHE